MSPQSAEDTGGSNLATSVKAKVKQLQEAQARTDARAKEIEILDVGLTTREHALAERIGDVERREKAQEEFVRTQSERVASLQRREEQLAASEQSVQLELKHLAHERKSLAERERTLADAERSLADWLGPDHAAAAPTEARTPQGDPAQNREIPPPPEAPAPPIPPEAVSPAETPRPSAVAPSMSGRRAVIGRLNQAITIARKLKDEGNDVFEVRELLRNARTALDRMDYEEVALLTDAILEALASVKVR